MKRPTAFLTLALGLFIGTYFLPPNPNIVEQYLQALKATMHEATTSDDIEALLLFYTDDVVYEHPQVGIRIEGKTAIREGMLRFMDAYAGSLDAVKMEIIDQIHGHDMAVIELSVVFKAKGTETIEEISRRQVKILEFEGEQIRRVIDYW